MKKSKPSTLVHGRKLDNWLRIARSWIDSRLTTNTTCYLCGCDAGPLPLCRPCQSDLPWHRTPWQKRLPDVDDVVICFDFRYPIRELIYKMKYGQDLGVASLLGELMADRIKSSAEPIEVEAALFPVPLSRRRLLQRGFNQATELALPIAAKTGLSIDVVSVYKPLKTRVQSTLDAHARRANARDAFVVKRNISVGTAIVVDDVLTTGATLSANARALKRAGAKSVVGWVLAAA